jgi:heme-degrading monooxygenase HmoA
VIAVIFEAEPHAGQRQAYFDAAAELRPLLEGMDGFISIERFESLTTPGKVLSLSFWHNDEGIAQWRRHDGHRAAQHAGRSSIFRHYRIRIAHVARDYGPDDREQAPDTGVQSTPTSAEPG